MLFLDHIWLVPLLPALGAATQLFFGRRLSNKAVTAVSVGLPGLSFAWAVGCFIQLLGIAEGTFIKTLYTWLPLGPFRLSNGTLGNFSVDVGFQLDHLSAVMLLVVTGIGFLIHVYSIGYMGHEGGYYRFFGYLNLFMFSMLTLVLANNYLMMFVGWEGVGLCSYLLIGFYFHRKSASDAGKKAFIVNRIGDFGFLIAMLLAFWAFGSLRFDEVFLRAEEMGPAAAGVVTAITLFLLVGATGKSAQLPLYVWLPDAMAGPTPVSALIHAATMVTAGIYMITRNHVLFELAPFSSNMVAWVGAATALFAATIAVGQYDIKKVLAYSTISQLGFMVAAVGLGAYVAGMFHLVTHAFFKALLFLSAGSVIQGVERGHPHAAQDHTAHGGPPFDPNDMRGMGGLAGRMRTTFTVYLIGAVALAGIPPLAGFFSKDEILAEASRQDPIVYWLLTAAAFLTAFYMGRQIWMVFFGRPRSSAAAAAVESPLVMTAPLAGLALLSVVGGALNLPGVHTLGHWLEHSLGVLEAGEFNPAVALLSVGLAGLAVALAWLLYGRTPLAEGRPDPLRRLLGPLFVGMENKWKVDELYDWLIVRRYVDLSRFLAETVDGRFWHDWFHDSLLARSFRRGTRWLSDGFDLPIVDGFFNGLARLTGRAAGGLRSLQTGYVRNYALALLAGAVVVLSLLLFG